MAGSDVSRWIQRFAGFVPAGGRVLDVACGGGRHTRFFLERGHPVTVVDRDTSGVKDLQDNPGVEILEYDLEAGPWPFVGRAFQGVVVTNYLWRPILPDIVAAVAPGGALLYDTFARGQEQFGRPHNPDFLLTPGELVDAVRGALRVAAYEDLIVEEPEPRAVQRIAARRMTE
ncbi:MAG TPA: class I SAM-dependent methyltransferase [Acidimicrobiia bacterium]|nr:class I SAM-dependent methyltransferase [Acidimicrobiia bacterium]